MWIMTLYVTCWNVVFTWEIRAAKIRSLVVTSMIRKVAMIFLVIAERRARRHKLMSKLWLPLLILETGRLEVAG
jgi:hypothetical protein